MPEKARTKNKGYDKFKLVFHSFILVFAITIIIASIMAWNEMDRAILYVILGIALIAESLYGLYKNITHKSH